jgi:hypothetical protein
MSLIFIYGHDQIVPAASSLPPPPITAGPTQLPHVDVLARLNPHFFQLYPSLASKNLASKRKYTEISQPHSSCPPPPFKIRAVSRRSLRLDVPVFSSSRALFPEEPPPSAAATPVLSSSSTNPSAIPVNEDEGRFLRICDRLITGGHLTNVAPRLENPTLSTATRSYLKTRFYCASGSFPNAQETITTALTIPEVASCPISQAWFLRVEHDLQPYLFPSPSLQLTQPGFIPPALTFMAQEQ